VAFTMLKWKSLMGRQPTIPDKGCMAKMFEPWQARPDSENTTLNNTTFTKWYNAMIYATEQSRIPKEILNNNTRNIAFNMNQHNTFIWPRHASREHFHTWMLPLYLDEEALDKEVMSWLGVKRGQRKLGMHYIFPAELLKKKDKEAEEGLSSGAELKKPDALTQTYSEEEEETLQLEWRKRPPPLQLPDNAVLSGVRKISTHGCYHYIWMRKP